MNIASVEVSDLIKRGALSLSVSTLPLIPPATVNELGPEGAANIKVNLLGQLESVISYQKNEGKSTLFLENELKMLNSLNGYIAQKPIDIQV